MLSPAQAVLDRLAQAGRLRLFLDYDGTLAELAPTPDHVEPNPEVVALVADLARQPAIHVTVLSGRRLEHVRELVPVPGIFLAGTYGIEILTPAGELIERVEYGTVRPLLARIRPVWAQLIAGRSGFYLEDKGWALALHARFAEPQESEEVLTEAEEVAAAVRAEAPPDLFRLLGGHKFLEIGPALAHKGKNLDYLLERFPSPGALPVIVGDDDKDEEAFEVIKARGGVALMVAEEWRPTKADFGLRSPRATRRWLRELLTMWSPAQVSAEVYSTPAPGARDTRR